MSKLKRNIKESIINGLSWLSKNQNKDGSFGSISTITTTALAIQAFENYAQIIYESSLSFNYKYNKQVNSALVYIFDNAKISSNGIYFEENENINIPTGAVLGAIASLGCPDCIINSNKSTLNGYTFSQLVNGSIDYLTFSQNANGGWGANSNSYDDTSTFRNNTSSNRTSSNRTSSNSTSSFVVGGLSLARANGYNIPKSIYENLQNWVNYIQNSSGGGGDTSPYEGVNISNTSILIEQMHFIGYCCYNENLKLAEQYIVNNWCNPVGYFGTGWDDCQNTDYKAAYEIMNSFSLYCTCPLKLCACTKKIYWFEDIIGVLLYRQNLNNSWPPSNIYYDQSDPFITTLWAILTLEKAVVYINCC